MSSEVTKMAGSMAGFQSSVNESKAGVGDETPENSISIFSTDYKKNDDLKLMLDSNKDNLKLEAMKRIIGMVAKGKNASDLFPAVVKNVVSKNMEVKKLVYVYLMRYAEEQQDLALLSISTFQRGLKDPNPLIRASALRVLSNIRVPIIETIMLLAIKEAVNDMSPYVRKTAANAIIKLYSLDPELKDDLIMIIEKLLADKTILVAGSAIQAFEAVCPERIDLIHKNFRKLCNLLVDVDEWGQVIIINMLIRYSRTQFTNPNACDNDANENTNNNNENNNNSENENENDNDNDTDAKTYIMDPDHRLILRSTKPLLQSRNSAVVMAVAQLYYYLAPKSEVQLIAKALIRLLRSYREVQIIVLKNIVTIAQKNKQIFEPYLKSFYVHSNDSIHIKLLKLEILTCLANQSNISTILREFQTYVLSNDKEFASATMHSIGRCASSISDVTEACLNGLVTLMSKKDETIVAESVVVIKRLLQLNPSKNTHIIKHMAKMFDNVSVSMARASILWLIGEYSDRVPKIAPDVLRKVAKTFCNEEDIVKLQTINLAVKLFITNHKQTQLLVQYILNLARYDQNYDIRDRVRLLRALTVNGDKCPNLAKHLKKFILSSKPAPVLESAYKSSDQFQLSTLSHSISIRVNGYTELPDFPTTAPDPSVRNVEVPVATTTSKHKTTSSKKAKEDKFYSDEENEKEETKSQSTEGPDPSDEQSAEGSSSSSSSDSEEDSDSNESGSASGSEDEKKETKKNAKNDSSESSSSGDEDEDESEEDSSSDDEKESKPKTKIEKQVLATSNIASNNNTTKQTSSGNQATNNKVQVQEKNDPKRATKNEKPPSSTESSSSSSEESSEEDVKPKVELKKSKQKQTSEKPTADKNKKSKNAEPVSLLDLDFDEKPVTVNTTNQQSSVISVLSPTLAFDLKELSDNKPVANSQTNNLLIKKHYDLLNKINGDGLQVQYRFPRTTNIYSNKMISVELLFTNHTESNINSIKILNKKLQGGMSMTDLTPINLSKGSVASQIIGIDFNDTTQPVQFELTTEANRKWNLTINCPVGELLVQNFMSENEFNNLQSKLKGMNEVSGTVDLTYALYTSNLHTIKNKLFEIANMCQISSSSQEIFKFASFTLSSQVPLLLQLKFNNIDNSKYSCQITINCEKIVLANMFLKEIKQLLA